MKKSLILTIVCFAVFLLTSLKGFSQQTTICPGQLIPDGWIVTGTKSCVGCCSPGVLVQMYIIKRIDNLPVGTVLTICPNQVIPSGWVVVGTKSCAGCGCTLPGPVVNLYQIKKLS